MLLPRVCPTALFNPWAVRKLGCTGALRSALEYLGRLVFTEYGVLVQVLVRMTVAVVRSRLPFVN